jgi:branched-subunit amino acid aminotransferase/4-amino-4-deoxychorismate lyase
MPEITVVLPGQSTELSPDASGFAHGFGFFETMHYAEGQLYAWEDHWSRLSRSAGAFGLTLPPEDDVVAALKQLVREADLYVGTLKLSLLRGSTNSRLFVYARPPLAAPGSRRLWLDREAPIFERSLLAGHKTHNYMENIHRLELARARGYLDVLRLDSQGRLAETATANIFFIVSGRLCTPELNTGILPGVTRARALRTPELRVEAGHYTLQDLEEADAFFVTNATSGIQAIERLDGLPNGGQLEFDAAHPALREIRRLIAGSQCSIQLR